MASFTFDPLVVYGVALCVALFAGLIIGKEAWLSARIIFRFLLTIALPILLVLAIPLWIVAKLTDIDERIWQAIVAGAVIATGWLTTAIFAELGRQRDRREKTRDYHRAIFAEIGNNLNNIYSEGELRAHADAVMARMVEDQGYVPFIPHESNDALFREITDEIQILPRRTIDPIVAYYSQLRAIAALIDDLRSPEYRRLTVERRIAMYEDYIGLKINAQVLGDHALVEINLFENGEIRAARALSRNISSRGAGQSGAGPGAE